MAVTIGNDLIGTMLSGSLPKKSEHTITNENEIIYITFFKKERRYLVYEDANINSSNKYLLEAGHGTYQNFYLIPNMNRKYEIASSQTIPFSATVNGTTVTYTGQMLTKIEPTDTIVAEIIINSDVGSYNLKTYVNFGDNSYVIEGSTESFDAPIGFHPCLKSVQKPVWPKEYKLQTLDDDDGYGEATIYKFSDGVYAEFKIKMAVEMPKGTLIEVRSNFDSSITGSLTFNSIDDQNDEIPHNFSVGTLKTGNLVLADEADDDSLLVT